MQISFLFWYHVSQKHWIERSAHINLNAAKSSDSSNGRSASKCIIIHCQLDRVLTILLEIRKHEYLTKVRSKLQDTATKWLSSALEKIISKSERFTQNIYKSYITVFIIYQGMYVDTACILNTCGKCKYTSKPLKESLVKPTMH